MPPISFQFQGLILYNPVLDHVLNDPTGDVGRYLNKLGRVIVVAAKHQVGVKTRALQISIHMNHFRRGAGQYIWIGSNNHIALAHHEGTRPHVILPSKHKLLRFSSGGRVIYTRKVNHPGTKPNRYLSDNLTLVRI